MFSLKLFLVSFCSFVVLDMLWISQAMAWFYEQEIGKLARYQGGSLSPLWLPALAVWALIVLGSMVFVLPRVVDASWAHTFAWGALFGLVLYGVYDFTNYALLTDWTLRVTLVDLAWGAFANGVLACLLKFLNSRI